MNVRTVGAQDTCILLQLRPRGFSLQALPPGGSILPVLPIAPSLGPLPLRFSLLGLVLMHCWSWLGLSTFGLRPVLCLLLALRLCLPLLVDSWPTCMSEPASHLTGAIKAAIVALRQIADSLESALGLSSHGSVRAPLLMAPEPSEWDVVSEQPRSPSNLKDPDPVHGLRGFAWPWCATSCGIVLCSGVLLCALQVHQVQLVALVA
jgi:hypothetical protein